MNELDQEALLDEIKRLLPHPLREETQLDGDVVLVGGDPGEVIVRIKEDILSIAVYSVRWEGSHTPVVRPEDLGTLNWRQLPGSRIIVALHCLIESAVELRRSRYGKCVRCRKVTPPEWMHNENTCQSCAERHLGVVH
jgi:hypothetical protein